MSDDTDAYLADAIDHEGKVLNGYRDSTPFGWFTSGIGEKSGNRQEMMAIPWVNATAGRPATPDEMSAEYDRVMGMPPNRLAASYRLPDGAAPRVERDPDEVDARARARIVGEFLPEIRRGVPAFDGYPLDARRVMLDISWNAGVGTPPTADKAGTGLLGFHKMIGAIDGAVAAAVAGDAQAADALWEEAAVQSHRQVPKGHEARNDWAAGLLRGLKTAQAA